VALLWLKLGLAPCLVALASLVSRRFGPKVGGWVAGFPIVAGPILFFFVWEQGPRFAVAAAQSTLLGIVSLAGFCLVYARVATRAGPATCLGAGWLAFGVLTWVQSGITPHWAVGLPLALLAIQGALRLLPGADPEGEPPRPGGWDIPVRMTATAGLVLALTAAARLLGPTASGLLTPFPVATTILVVFAHRAQGRAAAERVLSGLLLGLHSFAAFCLVLCEGLSRFGTAGAFVAAIGASAAVQLLVLRAVC
jgi:hypothetical protein